MDETESVESLLKKTLNQYRIIYFETINHSILGTMKLDFKNPKTGIPYDNIVFAGANGTGKTTILKIISTMLTRDSKNEIDYKTNRGSELYKLKRSFLSGTILLRMVREKNDTLDIKYLNGEISYRTRVLGQPHSSAFRIANIESRDSLKTDTYKTINHLIEKDSKVALQILTLNPMGLTKENMPNIKLRILSEFLLETFKMRISFLPSDDDIDNRNNAHIPQIINDDIGSAFSIEDLSSGEREILSRMLFILKNDNFNDFITVFIDEPELSLHPRWQKEIMSAYKSLFSKCKDYPQFFIATHSDHVLQKMFEDENTLIIKLEKGFLPEKISRVENGQILPRISLGEIKWSIFGLATIDFHNYLFGYLQTARIRDNEGNEINYSSKARYVSDMDEVFELLQNNLGIDSSWKNERKERTLPVYIRNQIDHPESDDREPNIDYDRLQDSIKYMIEIIKNNVIQEEFGEKIITIS